MKKLKNFFRNTKEFIIFVSGLSLCAIPWIIFGLIPELSMYGIWQLVSPESEFGRIALIAIFLVGGGAWCIFFAFLAFAGFIKTVEEFM